MDNIIQTLYDFRKKYRRIISSAISILIAGYFVFKRVFYGFCEKDVGNDFILECIVIIFALLDFTLGVIIHYWRKNKCVK
jgi:hypothetical protein